MTERCSIRSLAARCVVISGLGSLVITLLLPAIALKSLLLTPGVITTAAQADDGHEWSPMLQVTWCERTWGESVAATYGGGLAIGPVTHVPAGTVEFPDWVGRRLRQPFRYGTVCDVQSIHEARFGWPMRATRVGFELSLAIVAGGEPMPIDGAVVFGRTDRHSVAGIQIPRMVPDQVLVGGFLVNWATYAALLFGLAMSCRVVHTWRCVRAGTCVRCGYILSGAPGERCPECGAALAALAGAGERGSGDQGSRGERERAAAHATPVPAVGSEGSGSGRAGR